VEISITGVGKKVDGVYELEPSSITNREYHEIKLLTGLRYGELLDAFLAKDPALWVSYALLALRRADKDVNVDELWDAPHGSIALVFAGDEEDADAGPPASELPESSADSPEGSGATSSSSSGSPESDPSRTGQQGSDTSATSGPQT
jgi:hypothetical protein